MCWGSEFVPTIDEGNMLVRATMPASISLPRAIEISSQIEKTVAHLSRSRDRGRENRPRRVGGDPESVSNDEIYVRLKPKNQ